MKFPAPLRRSLGVSLALGLTGLIRAALPMPDTDDGGLLLPAGFRALIVADKLIDGRKIDKNSDQLRFLTVAPNGDLYAKTFRGGIIALRDNDGDGRFDEKHEFGSGAGTGIALHEGWLYYSTNSAVYRYPHKDNELVPAGEPQLIVGGLLDSPAHNAKSFAFDDQGHMLVEIGSPVNVYAEHDGERGATGKDATDFLKTHGGFWRFNPNQPNQALADGYHFSTGHRHSLALAWQPVAKEFFMAMMGRDRLNDVAPDYYDALDNAERVSEEMHRLREGVNLGWPYTYWDPVKKARMIAPEFGGDNRQRAEPGKYDEPVIGFPGHWAPLQMNFYTGTQFPAHYRDGAFIAFHGSWNRAPQPQDGFKVAFVPFDEKGVPRGTFEEFARNRSGAKFRMGGVAVGPDGSLYISETDIGRIWRIIYTGAESPADSAPAVGENRSIASTATINAAGQTVYEQICAACHMVDGTGAGQMQPALAGSAVVKGDAAQIIRVVLNGPAAVLPAERSKYSNVMPAFSILSNQQIADLLTYVRQNFGAGASPITAAQVAAHR